MKDKKQTNDKSKSKLRLLKRSLIHEVSPENDIKFRGPLSYRHLRIIGWLFLAIAQIAVLLTFSTNLFGDPNMYGVWPNILNSFSTLMAPLFLIAAFATVLVAKDGYKRLFFLYAGLSVLVYVAFLIVYQHYLIGLISVLVPDETANYGELVLQLLAKEGSLSFNIFIDLLLCTLITFFINYQPKKYFQGKKIYLFRAFVALPILYEISCVVLKALAARDILTLSPYVFPLLTTKAPMTFIIFIAMALFIKIRHRFYIKKGKSDEDYKRFLTTNVNSLHFSLFLSVAIVATVILDFLTFLLLYTIFYSAIPMPVGITVEQWSAMQIDAVYNLGFGQVFPLLLIIPLVLLFDYRKTYKNTLPDLIIPVAGVVLIAIIYLEGGFEVLRYFLAHKPETEPEEKLNPSILDKIIRAIRSVTRL